MSDYYPTYSLREDLTADVASWLQDQQGDGPLDLPSITDVCATHRVSAELRNEAGSIVGRVDAAGEWRLA